jgi:hypothetical protein
MFETSEILTESLELLLYQAIEIKAIVHRIARIVITTINSTRVNAFCCLFIIKLLKYILTKLLYKKKLKIK